MQDTTEQEEDEKKKMKVSINSLHSLVASTNEEKNNDMNMNLVLKEILYEAKQKNNEELKVQLEEI